MNCDEVFRHFTSVAAKPAANGTLERHLADCSACREMASLFGPAVELFETSDNDERSQVPAVWQRVWESAAVADRAAAQLQRRTEPRVSLWRRYGWPACTAAALLVGVLIGAIGRRAADAQEAARPLLVERVANDGVATNCDLLLAAFREAADAQRCPTCRRPVQSLPTRVVSLCAVCHIGAQGSDLSKGHVDPWLGTEEIPQDGGQSIEGAATS